MPWVVGRSGALGSGGLSVKNQTRQQPSPHQAVSANQSVQRTAKGNQRNLGAMCGLPEGMQLTTPNIQAFAPEEDLEFSEHPYELRS